jgi:predicted kinase
MAYAADLGVLHALAAAVLTGRGDAEAAGAREQVEWSALHAEAAGLLGEAPLAGLRAGLREALAGLDADAADRCWAEARESYALGRVADVRGAVAASWRWRSGAFPRLVQLTGPSGSGKSTFAERLAGADAYVCLDVLRRERGSRPGRRDDGEVLRDGLDRLDAALAGGGTVVWDATSLTPHQRSGVHAVARRRDALVTHAVLLVGEEELERRNAVRAHPVPPRVLTAQLRRFAPPYPGEAHRTWYAGADGAVADADGVLAPAPGGEEW